MNLFLIILGAASVMVLVTRLAAWSEAKSFNKGICKNCNTELRYFDTDSQGGRGYCCDKCNNQVWVSYNSVDRKFNG